MALNRANNPLCVLHLLSRARFRVVSRSALFQNSHSIQHHFSCRQSSSNVRRTPRQKDVSTQHQKWAFCATGDRPRNATSLDVQDSALDIRARQHGGKGAGARPPARNQDGKAAGTSARSERSSVGDLCKAQGRTWVGCGARAPQHPTQVRAEAARPAGAHKHAPLVASWTGCRTQEKPAPIVLWIAASSNQGAGGRPPAQAPPLRPLRTRR
jgi:hypothetical protein